MSPPTTTTSARNAVLNLLSLAEENEESNERNMFYPEIHSSLERHRTQFDIRTKLKLKSLCDEICIHLDKQKRDAKLISPIMNNDYESEEEDELISGISRSRRQSLDSLKSVEASETVTLRMAFGSLQNTSVGQLASTLALLMSDRMDRIGLLPATQDEEGQEQLELDILTSANVALTLSTLSLSAAKVYIHLISMKGAWSAGLVDVGALSSLSALIKRWCEECRGREKINSVMNQDDDESIVSSTKHRNHNKKRNKNIKANGTKKRRKVSLESDDEDQDFCIREEDESYGNSLDLDKDAGTSHRISFGEGNTSFDLIKSGLDIGLLLSDPFTLEEFRNWGIDAKDSFLDSCITVLATVSALSPTIGDDKALAQWSKEVHGKLSGCIVKIMSSAYFESINNGQSKSQVVTRTDNAIWSPTHRELPSQFHEEGTLGILRALYPFLTLQASLPNGVKGKVCAYDTAKSLLEDTLRSIQQRQKDGCLNMKINDSLPPNSPLKRTPAKTCPKTPASRSISRYSSLLKKDITPKTSRKALPMEEIHETCTKSISDQPRTFHYLLLGMMQKLITSPLLNKADARERALGCIMSWLDHMPTAQKSLLIAFANQMCRSKMPCHRLVGCEIIGRALSSTWFWAIVDAYYASENTVVHPPSTEALDICTLISSMDILAGRLLDRVPVVRARAAYSVVTGFEYLVNDKSTIRQQENAVRVIVSHCADLLINLAERVHSDISANVRKASVGAYSMILHFLFVSAKDHNFLANKTDIAVVFARACSDLSVSVRKAAVEGVTTILTVLIHDFKETHLLEDSFGNIWAENVLPLISDVESSCASQVVASFITLILEPIIQSVDHKASTTDAADEKKISIKAWTLLSKVVESSFKPGSTRSGTRALHSAIEKSLETYGNSTSTVLRTLLKRLHANASAALSLDHMEDNQTVSMEISGAMTYGTWCMLEAIMQSELVIVKDSKINASFLLSAWKKMFGLYRENNHLSLLVSLRSCLKIMSRVIPFSKPSDMIEVVSSLKSSLAEFAPCPQLIGDVIFTLAACQKDVDASEHWISFVYEKCESVLDQFISSPTPSHNDQVVKVVFTVGELSLVGYRNDECFDYRKNNSGVGRFYIRPSTKLITFVQALLLPALPHSLSGKSDYRPNQSVRAHAFVALGKLCIRDERLARESVDVFAQEMGRSDSNSTIQNNALLILGDLLKKYTHLIAKFLPMIESFLQFGRSGKVQVSHESSDDSCLVRRQAILLLSSLILQGYIKLKGSLYYRFLIAAVDENLLVSNLATLTLCGPMRTNYPKLFYNNFVETLFVLNSCESHPIHTAGLSEDQGESVSRSLEYLVGDERKGRRMEIYHLLLANMSDEEKIGITARLAKEILAAATESRGELATFCQQQAIVPSTLRGKAYDQRERAGGVLTDCFEILTSPCLRIARTSRKMIDEDEVDSSQSSSTIGPTPAQLNAVKGRLLTKISRKQLIETILPILNRLKCILETSKSPLLKALMQYMVCIFRQFKAEVREYLASEPTLLQELEYDTKKFEKEGSLADPTETEEE